MKNLHELPGFSLKSLNSLIGCLSRQSLKIFNVELTVDARALF